MENRIPVAAYISDPANVVIVSVGGGTYSTDIYTLVAGNPQFEIDSFMGDTFLCTTQTDAQPLTGAGSLNTIPFTLNFKPYELVPVMNYGGGHPPYVPRPTK